MPKHRNDIEKYSRICDEYANSHTMNDVRVFKAQLDTMWTGTFADHVNSRTFILEPLNIKLQEPEG